jgi:selenocysteine lyase/cysteine desulfurase
MAEKKKHAADFFVKSNILNLNWAGMSAPPKMTLEAMHQWNLKISEVPSLHAWTTYEPHLHNLRKQLAELIGAEATEVAIMRNATEALTNIILGLPLERGDEVILSIYDYPNLLSAWQQRAQRDGISLVWVHFETPSEDENQFIAAYTKFFTPKTRLVNLTHVLNWNGQIVPVDKIAALARAQGIEVLVDGSQSFGLFDYTMTQLVCDYFVTGLHKWLHCPIGTGLLFIRAEKIAKIYALMDYRQPNGTDILKFERFGISNLSDVFAIAQSIDFHYFVGGAFAKRKHLFALKKRWTTALAHLPDVCFFTPFSPDWSCAIGTFQIKNKNNADIVKTLLDKYGIHTITTQKMHIEGVRVSPSIATTEQEIDYFVESIFHIIS